MDAQAEIALGGSFAKVKSVGAARRGGGRRGPICGFSRQARKRMFDVGNSIPRDGVQPTKFVTLTYSDASFGQSWEKVKRDLRAFRCRLERRYGKVPYIWRLEVKPRLSGDHVGEFFFHVHLLVFGLEQMDKGWVSTTWYEIVGSGDPDHLAAGTNVKPVRDWRGAYGYLSKDMAKEQTTDVPTGRVWGVVNKALLLIRLVAVGLSGVQFYRLRRLMRKWLSKKLGKKVKWAKGRSGGLTCYMDSAAALRLLAFVAA